MASEINVEQMCRACLSSGITLISLFDSKTPFLHSQSPSLADMLTSLTSSQIDKDDGLPSKACILCISEISRSFSFKLKCENSEKTLKEFLYQAAEQEEAATVGEKLSLEVVLVKSIEEKSQIFRRSPKTQSPEPGEENSMEKYSEDEQSQSDDYSNLEIFEGNEFIDEEHINSDQDIDDVEKIRVLDVGNEEQTSIDFPDEIVLYGCTLCSQTFRSQAGAEEHADICSERGKLEARVAKQQKTPNCCPYCQVEFVHEKNLQKHLQRFHKSKSADKQEEDEDELLNPTNDSESLTKLDESSNEMETEEDQSLMNDFIEDIESTVIKPAIQDLPDSRYKCVKCGACFASDKSLGFHSKNNTCTRKQFECPKCKKVFINENKMIEHAYTHAKQDGLPCFKCEKRFTDKETLKEHVRNAHNDMAKNQCTTCGRVFGMLSTLKDHLRTHSGEKPFVCDICGKGFSQNTNLKQHVMRHTNTKPFACKQCNCTFVSKGELNSHQRKHTGDHPFVCDVCNTGFTTSSSLVKHKRMHTGERPYACEFCPMRFAALGTLKNHRRTHTGEKPFMCHYCGRNFTQKSDCVQHVRLHVSELPLNCRICGHTFMQHVTFKKHMRAHAKKDKNLLEETQKKAM